MTSTQNTPSSTIPVVSTQNTPSAAPLTDLMNAERLRRSIRRLFSGTADEILGELLQNSQRARATTANITTTDDGWVYHDDGHGLAGVEGFHTMLRLADSHFRNPTIAAQDPMGLGIHALLAHEDVAAVTFASGTLALTIDTARWWNDAAYYATWHERMQVLPTDVPGLQIAVGVRPPTSMASALHVALGLLDAQPSYSTPTHRIAHGYVDLLTITLNGHVVDTRVPFARLFRGYVLVTTTTYQNSELQIYAPASDTSTTRTPSVVNWYGQLVETKHPDFAFYLHVRDGRPVNPKAPTRSGLIDDAALRDLHTFIRATLHAWFHDPANEVRITPALFRRYYRYDTASACALPVCVIAPYQEPDDIGSVNDLEMYGNERMCRYEALPLLLDDMVTVVDANTHTQTYQYGLHSFVPFLPPAYALGCGDIGRVSVGTVWWQPGVARDDEFNEPGQWSIGTGEDAPTAWQPVPASCVYVFDNTSRFDVDDVEWIVGTTDPIAFYRNDAWAGFEPESDDYEMSYEERRTSYEESCSHHIRRLAGNAVPLEASLRSLEHRMPTRAARVVQLTYQYDDAGYGPVAVTVHNDAGETATFRIVD